MGHSIAIPVGKPELGTSEIRRIAQVVRSGWVTQGPMVREFEAAFADYAGAKHAIAVSSCTTALHLALAANGVGPRDEVIAPSHTFIATANAVTYCGAIPVFVDIDPRTFNIDPARIEAAITTRTKAILAVHQIGMPADLDRIAAIAKRRKLLLIEDAACAIGSEYKGRRIGAFSKATCFSFHPRKVITTGDGGMITTNDAGLAEQFRLLRQHGMSINDLSRHRSRTVVLEEYPIIGYNYRMTDLQAAMGLEQLKKLPRLLKRRKALAAAYTDALDRDGRLTPPFVPDYALPNYQSYCAYVNPDTGLSRDALMQKLLDRGISTRRGIMSIHREKPYRAHRRPGGLKHSEYASDNAVILPLYSQMPVQEQETVLRALSAAFRR